MRAAESKQRTNEPAAKNKTPTSAAPQRLGNVVYGMQATGQAGLCSARDLLTSGSDA